MTPDHHGATARPPLRGTQGLPQLVFRRSIAWLSDWLSTLRSVDYSIPTQDSLPAAGQALPDGLLTRKIPLKGFKVASLHLFLLSQASWHNHALICREREVRWGLGGQDRVAVARVVQLQTSRSRSGDETQVFVGLSNRHITA
jgi:hypothetical protein